MVYVCIGIALTWSPVLDKQSGGGIKDEIFPTSKVVSPPRADTVRAGTTLYSTPDHVNRNVSTMDPLTLSPSSCGDDHHENPPGRE